jgi:hypothetical protein
MRSDHDFTNSHLTRQTAFRSRIHSGQAIAVSLSVSQEDQPFITRFEVAALTVGVMAIVSSGIFETLIR